MYSEAKVELCKAKLKRLDTEMDRLTKLPEHKVISKSKREARAKNLAEVVKSQSNLRYALDKNFPGWDKKEYK